MLRRALNRPALPLFAVAALVMLAALLIAGLARTDQRVYAAGVPDTQFVATLSHGQRVCEGPIQTGTSFGSVGIFGNPYLGPASIRIDVQAHGTHRILGSAVKLANVENEFILPLNRRIAGRQKVDVCVRGLLGTFQLLGNSSLSPSMSLLNQSNAAFSLLLVNQHQTLLGALPDAFSRAALFKLSWLGSWTFWVLAALLLAAVGGAGYALVAADEDDDPPRADNGPPGDGENHDPSGSDGEQPTGAEDGRLHSSGATS
jgi:hypothetical protein